MLGTLDLEFVTLVEAILFAFPLLELPRFVFALKADDVVVFVTTIVVTVLELGSTGTVLLFPDTDAFALSSFGIFGKFAMTPEFVFRNDKTDADWFLLVNGDEVDEETFLLEECEDFDEFKAFFEPDIGELLFLVSLDSLPLLDDPFLSFLLSLFSDKELLLDDELFDL